MFESAITKAVEVYDLTSVTKFAEKGGVVGATSSIDHDGLDFSGYFPINPSWMWSSDWSIRIKGTFTDEDATVRRCFFLGLDADHLISIAYRGSTGTVYPEMKIANGNNFYSPSGGGVPKNELNDIVLTWDSATTTLSFYSNGVFVNDDSVAGGPILGAYDTNYDQVKIGAITGGTAITGGVFKDIQIYNTVLTLGEVEDLYNKSTFNFQNKSDVWLDMKSQTVNGSGEAITPDKSGKGNDFLLGDGSDTTKMPAFKNAGFDFDGSADYMSNLNAAGIYNNAEQSIVMCFKPDFAVDIDDTLTLYDSADSERYLAYVRNNAANNTLRIYLGGTEIADIAQAAYEPYWNTHGTNVLIVSGTTGDTDVWLNGNLILDADNTAWSPVDSTSIYIGSDNTGVGNFDGEICAFGTAPIIMTPTQVRQITQQLFNQYS